MGRSRISLARFLIRLGQKMPALALVLMRPTDLVEFSRQSYASSRAVDDWSHDRFIDEGFTRLERDLVERIPLKSGRLLQLGIGGGREAIPLARRGFEVTGVDYVPGMAERAIANAAKRGLTVQGLVQDIARLRVPAEAYDVVWFSPRLYSVIPTRRRRVELLRRLGKALRPRGYVLCQFHWGPAPPTSRLIRVLSRASLGYLEYETGDQLWRQTEFVHVFHEESALREEFTDGGFDVSDLRIFPESQEGAAVLKKRAIAT